MTADTYSDLIGLLLMGTGNDNNVWGTNANSAVFQIIEDAIAGALTSSVTGGTLDLSGSPPPSAASQVRYAALIFDGTLASNQVIKVPNLRKWWMVQNATAGAHTLSLLTNDGSADGSGSLLTLGTITGGAGYVTGTYKDVPLTGGSGTDATADIVVNGSGAVSSVTIKEKGSLFLASDSLSASNSDLGGAGSGFAVAVGTVGNLIPQNSGWQLVCCDGNANIVVSPFNFNQTQMPDGSVTLPSYSFLNETGTGWYRAGPNDIRFAVAGSNIFKVSATALETTNGPVLSAGQVVPAADGAVTAPGFAFNSEGASGIYRVGAGDIGISVLQVLRAELTSTTFKWLGSTVAGSDLSPAAISSDQNDYGPPGLGAVLTLGSITGGSAYTDGTYSNVALTTSGGGTGIKGTVVVSGGAVASVTLTDRGTGSAAGDTLSALTNDIGGTGSGFSVPVATVDTGTGSCWRLDVTAAAKLTGIAGGVAGRELMLLNVGTAPLQCPANSSSSSAANRFANAFNLVPGASITLRYDGTSSLWRPKNVATAFSACAVAAVSADLAIDNHSGSENTKVDISASGVVLVDTGGNAVKFANVSLTVDSGAAVGVGGLDQGTVADNTVYHVWIVSDGANIGAALSTSSDLATVLSRLATAGNGNYIYGKRVGFRPTDASGHFYRVRQRGNAAHFLVTASTNTANLLQLASGTAGDPAVPTWVSVTISALVGATAPEINLVLYTDSSGSTSFVTVAPSAAYGAITNNVGTVSNPPPLCAVSNRSSAGIFNSINSGWMPVEGTTIEWASNNGDSSLWLAGWRDAI